MAEKITDIKDKRSAFTLVELLLAMLVLAIVMGSALSLGYAYIKHFEQANEITVAKDRATMVLTYLERRILHTGLGMHTVLVSGDDFSDSFEGLWDNPVFDEPVFDEPWQRPVFLPEQPEEGLESESAELIIAYSVPSGVHTVQSGDVTIADSNVEISKTPGDGVEKNSVTKTKGWVVFPSVPMPFFVSDVVETVDNETLVLQARYGDWSIPINDELHFVRFLRAFIEDQQFKVQDLTISGAQPVIEGILGLKVVLNDRNVLTVSVLARGNRQYSRFISPAIIAGWGSLEDQNWRKYYLVALTKGWRIRN